MCNLHVFAPVDFGSSSCPDKSSNIFCLLLKKLSYIRIAWKDSDRELGKDQRSFPGKKKRWAGTALLFSFGKRRQDDVLAQQRYPEVA